jgi:uncharacterized iron-regulated protein
MLAALLWAGSPLTLAKAPAAAPQATTTSTATAAAAEILLIGEQHDQPDHQRQAAALVHQLAAQRRLHALVLEMAMSGASTQGLPADAPEPALRAALQWDDSAWPWSRYRELVLAATRAGVPVWGGNLPRPALRQAQADVRWDSAIPQDAAARLLAAVREGHCGLVPDAHLGPMVRMQVARDRALAEALLGQWRTAPAGRVVVLHAGAVHAARRTGVPLHLTQLAPEVVVRTLAFGPTPEPADFDERRPAEQAPSVDHCAELRQRGMPDMAPARPASEAASPASATPATSAASASRP